MSSRKAQAQWRYPVGRDSEDDPARAAFLRGLTSGGADALTTTRGRSARTRSAKAKHPALLDPDSAAVAMLSRVERMANAGEDPLSPEQIKALAAEFAEALRPLAKPQMEMWLL